MNKVDPRNAGLFVLLALFLWALVDGRADASGGGGDEDNGIIAVTGTYGSGSSVLYIIDSKTRHMSVYRVDPSGTRLELVAARDCTYDFLLQTYHDRSEPEFLPASLKRSWDRRGRVGQPAPDNSTPGGGAGKPEVGPKVRRLGGGKGN